MTKMENVMSVRLPKEDVRRVEEFAVTQKKDKSTAVRELVEMGRIYFAIQEYTEGRISIGKAAEGAGITLIDMMDLLTKFGIKNKVDIEDYLEGMKIVGKYIK